jgi:hypothetical protein
MVPSDPNSFLSYCGTIGFPPRRIPASGVPQAHGSKATKKAAASVRPRAGAVLAASVRPRAGAVLATNGHIAHGLAKTKAARRRI